MTQPRSSLPTCECPTDGILLVPFDDTGGTPVAIDFIAGYPAEHGWYEVEASYYGFDRGIEADADFRELLGLPSEATTEPQTLLFKLGSAIKASALTMEYPLWKAYRMDCSCVIYDCEGNTDVTGVDTSYLQCTTDRFNGFDTSPDQVEVDSAIEHTETVGVGLGTAQNDSITTMGLSGNGSFENFVDKYGIIYSSEWERSGSTTRIVTITKDPRVAGEDPSGSVQRTANGLRVFRRGTITRDDEVLRSANNTSIVVSRSGSQSVETFQAGFGCGDVTADPFSTTLGDNGVTDRIEIEANGTLVLSDPEHMEFDWAPGVVVDSDGVTIYIPGSGGMDLGI